MLALHTKLAGILSLPRTASSFRNLVGSEYFMGKFAPPLTFLGKDVVPQLVTLCPAEARRPSLQGGEEEDG